MQSIRDLNICILRLHILGMYNLVQLIPFLNCMLHRQHLYGDDTYCNYSFHCHCRQHPIVQRMPFEYTQVLSSCSSILRYIYSDPRLSI